MKLAKPHLDIGLFTNDVRAHRGFWADEVGVPFDHELPMGPGWAIHRFDAHGSVVKVNHRVEPLPARDPSGFATLTIAREGIGESRSLTGPGGEGVQLVEPGTDDVTRIGITITSPNPGRLVDFYATALEFDELGPDRLRCGDSILTVVEGPGGVDGPDHVAPGYRYLTVQIFDADREMAGVVRRGGRIARDPVDYPGIARYGFVADPDGNWTELSARTQWTGVEVS
ncbi:VOC family protein [Pseudonocardia alni]|uniref:VOC family protein n=1 Tax=Pseudonocardia alni TaxID=33907 RepID=UPI00280AF284|nr:VOC family protein [Pseudonocardia alni]